jgi:hypothetical protein
MSDIPYWQKQYEMYVARWPGIAATYKTLPAWHKRDCANAMKWWVALGLVKENT